MPKILSFGNREKKLAKANPFKFIWEWILSLDKFTKLFLITIVLISGVTPAIVSSLLIFNPDAATTSTNTISSSQASTPSTTTSVAPKTSATGTTTAPQTFIVDTEIKNELNLLNYYRSQNGLSELKPSVILTQTAIWMANDMASKNYFSHTDSLERNPFQRMDNFGYTFNTWRGENLAAGSSLTSVVMQLWKDSPGHNANMLNPNYNAVGLYRAYNSNSVYKWYWAQELGGTMDTEIKYITHSEVDSDGDGFSDEVELYLGTNPNKACATGPEDIDATKPGHPSLTWPADLNTDGGIPATYNKVTLQDLTGFMAPIRRINTSPGDDFWVNGVHNQYDRRWDLVPGKGLFSKDINVQDITNLTAVMPPMFGGTTRAFNGPACTP